MEYFLKAFHHMVCPCTSSSVCVVCPWNNVMVGGGPPTISIWTTDLEIVNPRANRKRDGAGWENFRNQLYEWNSGYREGIEKVTHHTMSVVGMRTQPRAFVSPSAIEKITGKCPMTMFLAPAQSWMAKCWISMWQDHSVGTWLFISPTHQIYKWKSTRTMLKTAHTDVNAIARRQTSKTWQVYTGLPVTTCTVSTVSEMKPVKGWGFN